RTAERAGAAADDVVLAEVAEDDVLAAAALDVVVAVGGVGVDRRIDTQRIRGIATRADQDLRIDLRRAHEPDARGRVEYAGRPEVDRAVAHDDVVAELAEDLVVAAAAGDVVVAVEISGGVVGVIEQRDAEV